MEALYVAIPVYLPDEFHTCEESGASIVVGWLVPVSAADADHVHDHGWSSFEDLLVEHDPDLVDGYRPSLQLVNDGDTAGGPR